MASITTEGRAELIALYTAMYNAAPGANNLNDMVAMIESGKTLLQVSQTYTAKAEFNSVYPALLTADEFAAKLVANMLGSEVSAGASTWATNWVKTQLASGKGPASVIATAVQSLRATTNTDFASAKAALANKVDVATYYSVTKLLSDPDLVDLQAVIKGVTSASTTVTTAKASVDAIAAVVIAQTFTLTTGANNVVGSAGNDNIAGGTKDSWSAFDNIDGGDGNDTMDVYLGNTFIAIPGASTLKNVETLNLNTDGAGFTIDTTSMTGLTKLNLSDSAAGAISVTGPTTLTAKIVGTGASTVDVIGTGGDLQITTGGSNVTVGGTAVANALTSVTVDGGAVVAISDKSGAAAAVGSKLTSVSLKGNTGAATVTSNGLTSLTLTNNAQNATVTAAAGTRALTVNLNKATAGIIADAEATTLTVKNSGSASSGVTLNAAKATSVTLDAASSANLTVADVNIAAATTLTATGAGKVTVSATSTVTALTTVDASANTGGLVITPALGTGVTFTGGAGADTVTLGATTKTITMGAGNDRVVLSTGVSALGSGGTIDAGDGTDTLAMAADDVNTASGATTFETKISNFEEVELAVAGTAGVAVNMANLDDISKLKVSVNVNQVVTVSNMASGGTVSYTAAADQAAATTIGVLNANSGTEDVLNISISSAAGRNINTLTVADVETINIASDDSATTITNISHTASLTAASVKTIKVTGDAGLALTNTATTVTSFDASGVTGGGLVSWTTGALAASATIIGSATIANTINTSASSKAMTYTGGAAVDTITTGAGNDTINTAAGNDVISAGAGNDTIDAGAGDDSITTGTGLDMVTGGAGADTFVLSVNANGNTYATISDAAKSDILTFVDKGTETFTTAKITLADTAAFQDFLDAAAAGDGSTNGAIKWFQYGGNTYVVEDMNAANTFQNGVDLVVKLTGAVDLSTATGAGTNVLTLA